MADQISCARCQHANPPENRFCGWCGASLRPSTDLMARREGSLTVMGHALPVKPGPIGTALAVGLGTLAMRAGISWLRHRITAEDRSSTLTTREYDTALSKYYLGQGIETILIQESGEFHPGRTIAWQAIRLIAATEQTAPSSRKAGGSRGATTLRPIESDGGSFPTRALPVDASSFPGSPPARASARTVAKQDHTRLQKERTLAAFEHQ
jgi:Double zinc ribbon